MISVIKIIIDWFFRVLIFGLFIYIVLGYFLPVYHPIRRLLGRIFDPLLRPIQHILPSLGGFDISPMVVMLLLWLINSLIIGLLNLIH